MEVALSGNAHILLHGNLIVHGQSARWIAWSAHKLERIQKQQTFKIEGP